MLTVSVFRSLVRALGLMGVALLALLPAVLPAQSTPTAADGFDPNLNGNVLAITIQPDGKILVGGSFTETNPNGTGVVGRFGLARFHVDGSLDTTFNPGAFLTGTSNNAEVRAIALQTNGQIVVGGKFVTIGGVARSRIARLNADGSLDSTFNPNILDADDGGSLVPQVNTIVVQADGKIVIGGGFTSLKPNGTGDAIVRNRIARLNTDGTVDDTFSPSVNSMVLALALDASQNILIGGGFTTIQSTGSTSEVLTFNRIARVSPAGIVDQAFNPNFDNAVSSILVQPDGLILIGGSFKTLNPKAADTAYSRTYIVRLNPEDGTPDGTVGDTLGSTITYSPISPIVAMARQNDGKILIAADVVRRLTALGPLDSSFSVGTGASAQAIAVQADGGVVVGGGFITVTLSNGTTVARNHLVRVSPSGVVDTPFTPTSEGRPSAVAVDSTGRIVIGGNFTNVSGVTRLGLARLASDGALDTSFKVELNAGVISILPLSGGDLIIAGAFTTVNGETRNRIAKIKSDGTLDASFNPNANAEVRAMLLQSDGKIVLGGSFSSLQPNGADEATTRTALARINADGTLDTTFLPAAGDTVVALALQSDGKIVVGGNFTTMAGTNESTSTTALGIGRLNADGTMDKTFKVQTDGTVRSLAVLTDGKIVFGGIFTQVVSGENTVYSRKNVARIATDGSIDTAFDPSANFPVIALLAQAEGRVIIAGSFTDINPNESTAESDNRRYVARFNSDGKIDTAFNLNVDAVVGNIVSGLAQQSSDKKVLLVGTFRTLQPTGSASAVARTRVARVTEAGALDTTFSADVSGQPGLKVNALAVQTEGKILVAGEFDTISGSTAANVGRFAGDGLADAQFNPATDGAVRAVAVQPSGSAVSTQSNGVAFFKSDGTLSSLVLEPALASGSTVDVVSQLADGSILIGGALSVTYNSVVYSNLVRYLEDGTFDPNFRPLPDAEVTTILQQSDGKVLIGGLFTVLGETSYTYLARFNADLSVDTAYKPTPNGQVAAMAFQTVGSDTKLLIAGSFSSVTPNGATTSTTRSAMARLNLDGTVDTAFDPSFGNTVSAIQVLSDGDILVGGQFTTLAPNGATTSTSRSYAARLNADGTVDTALDLKLNGQVIGITLQADNKILLAGSFSSILGATRNNLARLNADGTLDTGFAPLANSSVVRFAVQPSDGKILVVGAFTTIRQAGEDRAIGRNYLARLNTDGTVDTEFDPNLDAVAVSLIIASDGTIIVGGNFTTAQPYGSILIGGTFNEVNGAARHNLALLNASGGLAITFQPDPNGVVNAFAMNADGRFVVGGEFTELSGTTRNRVARFAADGTLDTAFNPNANGAVYALALQSDGKLLLGGAFTQVGGVARSWLARVHADGSVDSSFNASLTGAVRGLLVQPDGKLLVIADGSGVRSVLARLNTDGSADGSFAPANGGSEAISAIALQSDGKVLVGGAFASLAGSGRAYLARLDSSGVLDANFTTAPNGAVTAITIQSDGKLVLGGNFSAIDGLTRFGLARITATDLAVRTVSASAERDTLSLTQSGTVPELSGVFFEQSTDLSTWTELGSASRVGSTHVWSLGGLDLADSSTFYVRARGFIPSAPYGSSGMEELIWQLNLAPSPVITGATAVSGAAGSSFLYSIAAKGSGPITYSSTTLPAGLTLDAATGIISGTPTQAGTYTVTVTATNSYGSTSRVITIIVATSGGSTTDAGRLLNLSLSGQVTQANYIVAGLVISGSKPHNVVLRGVGPSLKDLGVTDYMPAPRLQLFNVSGHLVAENAGWSSSETLRSLFARLGAFPLKDGSADAVISVTLDPGVYTVFVRSDSEENHGLALAEVYDATPTPMPSDAARLVNLSGRGQATNDRVITGGFVISGNVPRQLLIRGIGPGLTALGLSGALANPGLRVYNSSQQLIAENFDWETPLIVHPDYTPVSGTELKAAATTVGAFALASGSKDAAVLVTLAPGVYTALVRSVTGELGEGMVEIYLLP